MRRFSTVFLTSASRAFVVTYVQHKPSLPRSLAYDRARSYLHDRTRSGTIVRTIVPASVQSALYQWGLRSFR